jgi:hypothetical protein
VKVMTTKGQLVDVADSSIIDAAEALFREFNTHEIHWQDGHCEVQWANGHLQNDGETLLQAWTAAVKDRDEWAVAMTQRSAHD